MLDQITVVGNNIMINGLKFNSIATDIGQLSIKLSPDGLEKIEPYNYKCNKCFREISGDSYGATLLQTVKHPLLNNFALFGKRFNCLLDTSQGDNFPKIMCYHRIAFGYPNMHFLIIENNPNAFFWPGYFKMHDVLVFLFECEPTFFIKTGKIENGLSVIKTSSINLKKERFLSGLGKIYEIEFLNFSYFCNKVGLLGPLSYTCSRCS